ncbi:MAG: hypothetical protein JXB88_01530 [Spirochaetales bacterium]|nr:hypothetical protein [Spirochaetales bacterium]
MVINMKKNYIFFICLLLFFVQTSLHTANIDVSSLEIICHGAYDETNDYDIVLATDGEMEMSIEGGYKFGASVVFGFRSENLEDAIREKTLGLLFKSGQITVREILGSLMSFSFFIGENDILCSGEGFVDYFGTDLIKINYSGFLYFPEGKVYEGIHTVSGTGCSFIYRPLLDRLLFHLYAYQDDHFVNDTGEFIPGQFSLDLRTIVNFEPVKLDFFLGATGPCEAEAGYYRTGLLLYAKAGFAEFFAQAGIPRWDPVDDLFRLDLFFLLFETKLNLGIVAITPSFFIHPGYYEQNPTDEEEIMDINVNIAFGDIFKHLVSGGIEGNFSFTENLVEGLNIKVFPFISFITPGVVWQLKCGITLYSDPLPYDNLPGMFEGFINIKAGF